MHALKELTVEISRQSVHVIGIDTQDRRTILVRLPCGAAIPPRLRVIVFNSNTPPGLMAKADVRIHEAVLCPSAWTQILHLLDATRVHPRVRSLFGSLMILLSRIRDG